MRFASFHTSSGDWIGAKRSGSSPPGGNFEAGEQTLWEEAILCDDRREEREKPDVAGCRCGSPSERIVLMGSYDLSSRDSPEVLF